MTDRLPTPFNKSINQKKIYDELPPILKADFVLSDTQPGYKDVYDNIIDKLYNEIITNYDRNEFGYKTWSITQNRMNKPSGVVDYFNYILKNSHIKRACSLGIEASPTLFNEYKNGIFVTQPNGIINKIGDNKIKFIPKDAEASDYYVVKIRLPYNKNNRSEEPYRLNSIVDSQRQKENVISLDYLVPKAVCYNLDGDGRNYLNNRTDQSLVASDRFGGAIAGEVPKSKHSSGTRFYSYDSDDFTKCSIFIRLFCAVMRTYYAYTDNYTLNYGTEKECACINNELYDKGQDVYSELGTKGIPNIPSKDNLCRISAVSAEGKTGTLSPENLQFVLKEQYDAFNPKIELTVCSQNINMNNVTAGRNFAMTRTTLVQACGNKSKNIGEQIAAALDDFTSKIQNQVKEFTNISEAICGTANRLTNIYNNRVGAFNRLTSDYSGVLELLNSSINTNDAVNNLVRSINILYNDRLTVVNAALDDMRKLSDQLDADTLKKIDKYNEIQSKFKVYYDYLASTSKQYYYSDDKIKEGCDNAKLGPLTPDIYKGIQNGEDVGANVCIDKDTQGYQAWGETRRQYILTMNKNKETNTCIDSFTRLYFNVNSTVKVNAVNIENDRSRIIQSATVISYNFRNLDLTNAIQFVKDDNLTSIDTFVNNNSSDIESLTKLIINYQGSNFNELNTLFNSYTAINTIHTNAYRNMRNNTWVNNIGNMILTQDINKTTGHYNALLADKALLDNKYNAYTVQYTDSIRSLENFSNNDERVKAMKIEYVTKTTEYQNTVKQITDLITSIQEQLANNTRVLDLLIVKVTEKVASASDYYRDNFINVIVEGNTKLSEEFDAFNEANTAYVSNKSNDNITAYNTKLLAIKNRLSMYNRTLTVNIKERLENKDQIYTNIRNGLYTTAQLLIADIDIVINLSNDVVKEKIKTDSKYFNDDLSKYSRTLNTYKKNAADFIRLVDSITQQITPYPTINVPDVVIPPPQRVEQPPPRTQEQPPAQTPPPAQPPTQTPPPTQQPPALTPPSPVPANAPPTPAQVPTLVEEQKVQEPEKKKGLSTGVKVAIGVGAGVAVITTGVVVALKMKAAAALASSATSSVASVANPAVVGGFLRKK